MNNLAGWCTVGTAMTGVGVVIAFSGSLWLPVSTTGIGIGLAVAVCGLLVNVLALYVHGSEGAA